jgi:hypothetical protein
LKNSDGRAEAEELEGAMGRRRRMFISCLADESDNMSNFPSWFPEHYVNGSSRSHLLTS